MLVHVSRGALAWSLACLLGAIALGLVLSPTRDRLTCPKGFVRERARCLVKSGCPAPFVSLESGACEAKLRVAVERTKLTMGASDWEAEGKVAAREVSAGPLWIDAFEVTARAFAGETADPLRAASGMSREAAATYCAGQGGRLPTEDEWMVAAAGLGGHRYPWGETGAVCRRAVFGMAHGPCSSEGVGPDTVGAHPDGDSTRGVHDLAGNVAEWVAPSPDRPTVGVAKGGSWRAELATELRVWARLELDPSAHDDRIGVRCAYDAP